MSEKTMLAALEKLTKWRRFFASWQLGSRPPSDGEFRAIVHHRELSILLRAEVSALTGLLLRKGVFTEQEWRDALELEATQLDHDYEETYPGWRSVADGMSMKMPEALETMTKLGFPP
jgi:hypothetical protein